MNASGLPATATDRRGNPPGPAEAWPGGKGTAATPPTGWPSLPGPRDFASKVRWRMAFDRNPLFPVLQDKVRLRGFAKERGVACADLLHVTEDPADLPFDTWQADVFIKANHGCGWNLLVHRGDIFYFGDGRDLAGPDGALHLPRSQRISRAQCVDICRRMLDTRYPGQEWAYSRIPPRIFAERRLYPPAGGELLDHRLFTFAGKVRAIGLGSSRYRSRGLNVYLDPEWKPFPLTAYGEAQPDPLPDRPGDLADLIAAAERLGAGLDFLRVDLYRTSEGIRLGELTLYPSGGAHGRPTACPRFNTWLGDQWRLPGLVLGNAE